MEGLFDQHLHSRHSFDSKADPEANVRTALEKGLSGLIFTGHYDLHPDDRPTCCYNESDMVQTIEGLRNVFGDRIFIGKGIEICYQPELINPILEFLRANDFDMVILSVHYFAGHAIHRKASWQGRTTEAVTRAYFETVLDAVRFCERLHEREGQVFHVLGHLDLVKRYAARWREDYDAGTASSLVSDILRTCLSANLVPEINTSGWRQGVGASLPGEDMVREYASLGGTTMSLGSDAHVSEHIGADFDRAVEMMTKAGIQHAATFRAGRRMDVVLENAGSHS